MTLQEKIFDWHTISMKISSEENFYLSSTQSNKDRCVFIKNMEKHIERLCWLLNSATYTADTSLKEAFFILLKKDIHDLRKKIDHMLILYARTELEAVDED